MTRCSCSFSAGLRIPNVYSTATEQPTAMDTAAISQSEFLTNASAGAWFSQNAIKVQKMNPQVEASGVNVVESISTPARKATTATESNRAKGSLSLRITTA